MKQFTYIILLILMYSTGWAFHQSDVEYQCLYKNSISINGQDFQCRPVLVKDTATNNKASTVATPGGLPYASKY